MVYFQFPENVTSVNITAHSDSNATCVIVSIQNASVRIVNYYINFNFFASVQ